MADKVDLTIYQGDDYSAVVDVLNEDGTPTDLTGYTAKSQIRRSVADASPAVVVEIGATVQSPFVFLSIPHADTEPLNGKYVWDLQLTAADGIITTLLYGQVTIQAEVTRGGATRNGKVIAAA
jgi:hypothetical protein